MLAWASGLNAGIVLCYVVGTAPRQWGYALAASILFGLVHIIESKDKGKP